MSNTNDHPFSQSTYGILAILSEGAKSGYEIKKFLSGEEVFYWRESFGNIYPILKKLKAQGLVRQFNADIKKKRRIYYEITEAGDAELRRWLTTPPTLTRFRVEVLMKLRFGKPSGIENMISNIEHYRNLNISEIDECHELIEKLQDNREDLTDDVRVIAALYLLRFKQAINDWCSESIEILSKSK
ncbi:MAG: PadR family transcriptional regulator [Candidatus Fermentibacteria bacterium]